MKNQANQDIMQIMQGYQTSFNFDTKNQEEDKPLRKDKSQENLQQKRKNLELLKNFALKK